MKDHGRLGAARRAWRFGRWLALAGAGAALWACQANRLVKPEPAPEAATNDLYEANLESDIDILFMIDDSSSMTPLQGKLTSNFPVFMQVLETLPGGLPNVHIGVISSSMGAGRNPSIDHCPPGGDRGVFHTAPLGATCGRGGLNAGQHFISHINGITNYTGDIADVFSCIAALGEGGCGFEHQLESVLRALGADGAPPPEQNVGFLRPNAYLAVVLITNEDDCSAPPDSDLFDSSSELLTDPLGPLQSYRCNEFGHLCGGRPPPRTPSGPVDLTNTCTSAEDGRLLRVADVVAALKSVKPDPEKLLVAAIAGPPNPYVVETVPAGLPDTGPWPVVGHSCTTTEPDGSLTYGDPSVRIAQWVKAFGARGTFETICGGTFEPALRAIANQIVHDVEPSCIEGQVLDTRGAPWMGATTPDCTVTDHATNDEGVVIDSKLPSCAPGQEHGTTACWSLVRADACGDAPIFQFNRPDPALPRDLRSSVSCAILACPPAGTPGAPAACAR